MPKNLPFTNTIPDAHYRCEGVDLGTERVSEIHFRAEDGGFLPAGPTLLRQDRRPPRANWNAPASSTPTASRPTASRPTAR